MRVEVNLPGSSAIIVQFVLQVHYKKMFKNENEGQSVGWSTTSTVVSCDGKYQVYKKNITCFALAFKFREH